MTTRKALETAQEIVSNHEQHEVTFDLSDPEIALLKKGAKAMQAIRPQKGSRGSEWATTIATTVHAVEAVDDKANRHTCPIWELNKLKWAAAYSDSEGMYDLAIRLRDLPKTSPYYEAARTAQEQIDKLKQEEDRLTECKEVFEREIAKLKSDPHLR